MSNLLVATLCVIIGLTTQQKLSIDNAFNRAVYGGSEFDTNSPIPKIVLSDAVSKPGEYRLNNSLTPTEYKLYINTNFNNLSFNGLVEINLEAQSDDTKFRIHATEIELQSVNFTQKEIVQKISYKEIKDKQYYEITVEKGFKAGQTYSLKIAFKGKLKVPGYFKAEYMELGKKKIMSATHFEPTKARYAFPCFDEPALKAVFHISLEHDAERKAFANTAIKEVQILPNSDRRITHFDPTPKMSTYLIAYALADYDTTVKLERTRVLARQSLKNLLNYSLETGNKILNKFETLFNVKYPISKMDHIAVTEEMSGAMENWGLITYTESALLYIDNGTYDMGEKKGVATILAHELAHQWFGNIVTPKWWDDIWLNEGFATYFSYRIMVEVESSWNPMDLFAFQVLQFELLDDSKENTRALDKQAESPDEISSLFDNVGYSKAGCLLYMFENLFGSKIFIEGLSTYLKTNSFKAVEKNDLWTSLQKAVTDNKLDLKKKTVKEISESWYQPGYPLVTLTLDKSNTSFTLDQVRFVVKDGKLQKDSKAVWVVPITWINDKSKAKDATNTTLQAWLDKKSEKYPTPQTKWVILNNQQSAYYRVNYDVKNWNAIIEYLEKSLKPIISDRTKSQLLDDSHQLAILNEISFAIPLGLTRFLVRETGYVSWANGVKIFEYFEQKLRMHSEYENLKKYFRYLVDKAYKSAPLGSKPKGEIEKYKKELLIKTVLKSEHPALTTDALKLFNNTLNEKNWDATPLDKNERSIIYCAVAKADAKQAKILETKYDSVGSNAKHMDDLFKGATCAKDEKYLKGLADEVLAGKKFKKHTKAAVISLAENNGPFMFKHFNDNYKAYEKAFSTDEDLSAVIEAIADNLATKEQMTQLEKVMKYAGSKGKLFAKAIESSEDNIQWNVEHKEVEEWVKEEAKKRPDPSEPTTVQPVTTEPTKPTLSTTTQKISTTTDPGGYGNSIHYNGVSLILGLLVLKIFV